MERARELVDILRGLEEWDHGPGSMPPIPAIAANATRSQLATERPTHQAISHAVTAGFTAAFEIGTLISLAGFVLALLVICVRSPKPVAEEPAAAA